MYLPNSILSLDNDPGIVSKLKSMDDVRWVRFACSLIGVNDPATALARMEISLLNWCSWVCIFRNEPPPSRQIPSVRAMLPANINHSRWVVECPYCRNAELACKSQPLFWCVNCRLVGNKGEVMTVVFPDNVDEIEGILLRRIDPTTRHWYPGESVDDLRKENADHGVGAT